MIGAGPAGMAAATRLADRGIAVTLVDESAQPGGQVHRAPTPGGRGRTTMTSIDAVGDGLRSALGSSNAVLNRFARVWSVGPGFRVDAIGPDGPATTIAPTLVVATGTVERHVPFPGWTLPGVIGLAGATILMKSHGLALGERVVVAGAGPLLALVAAGLVAKGKRVVAVVDAARRRDWIAEVPAFASRPDLFAIGLGWRTTLKAAGVPWHYGHAIVEAEGRDHVEAVRVAPIGSDGHPSRARARRLGCDAVAVGYGLVPNTELIRALGAATQYEPTRGGFVPVTNTDSETTVPNLFVAGDGAGVSGAAAAVWHGRAVAEAIAARHGQGAPTAFEEARRRFERARRFGAASARLTAPRPDLVHAIPGRCVVCRCEDVTRDEIETAIAAGAREVNQVKAFTRAGMGPCQGRTCGDAVAELVALHVGSREAAGQFTARPPFRPVDTAALIGTFDYADIPIPPPAPL